MNMKTMIRVSLFVLLVATCVSALTSANEKSISTTKKVTTEPNIPPVKTTKGDLISTTLPPTIPEKSTVVPTRPHCIKGQRKAITGSCKDYVECDETFKWVQKSCSTLCKVFEAKSSKCVWNWQSPCMKPPTTVPEPSTAASTTTSNPVSTTPKPECIDGKNEIYKKGDCKNYLGCVAGKWTKKACSWGQHFDVNKLECRLSWFATC